MSPVRRRPLGDGTYLVECDVVSSTQDEARARLRAGLRGLAGVRAGYQVVGRGQERRRWVAPPDTCLLVTYVLEGDDCRPERANRLAFVAGVAVCEALRVSAGLEARLRWPNDVVVGGRKLAGILVETVAVWPRERAARAPQQRPHAAALVGIGLNVNVDRFAPEVGPGATSVLLETGRVHAVEDIEEAVRVALRLSRPLAWEETLARWRALDATAGVRFGAKVEGVAVEGTAEGVADSGALLLRCGERILEVMSATHCEPA